MNELDPLSQLRDIHLPDPVGLWPLAPGWWLLMLLSLALLVGGGWWLYNRWQRRRYRRTALRLEAAGWSAFQKAGSSAEYLSALTGILRRAALRANPGQGIERLQGEAWLHYLDQTLPTPYRGVETPFTGGEGRWLLSLPYQPPARHDPEKIATLHRLVRHWLRHHKTRRPPARNSSLSDPGQQSVSSGAAHA